MKCFNCGYKTDSGKCMVCGVSLAEKGIEAGIGVANV